MITEIIFAAAVLGGIGLLTGLFLGIASETLKPETDHLEGLVLEALPGINCGRCGYAGCNALAQAIVSGNAGMNGCPVGGKKSAEKIREIMGAAES